MLEQDGIAVDVINARFAAPVDEKIVSLLDEGKGIITAVSIIETNHLRNAGAKLTRMLRSVKLAIVVLLLLGIVSVIGTLIPQGGEYEKYVKLYGPLIASIVSKAGLTRVFSSWWFLLLVGCLASSMTVCSVTRLRNVLRAARKRSVLLEESEYERAPYHQDFSFSGDAGLSADDLRKKVIEVLKKNRYRVAERFSGEGVHCVSADKGFLGILGPFLVHLSIIIIIVGGVWTVAGRFSHFLNVGVGESVNVPQTPYSVHLHDFIVEYYEGTNRPKEYISRLSVTENGRVIGKGELKVNAPLSIEGLHFYQMEYASTVADVTIAVTAKDDGKEAGEFTLPMHQASYIEQIGLTVKPNNFLPDFVLTANRVAVSRSGNFNNPAVLLEIYLQQKYLGSKWVFFDLPKFHISEEAGYVYELKDFTRKTFSGIKVVRDRAVPMVYAGFSVLVLGTFLSCYVFHRRIWTMVKSSQGQIKLRVAGACNRNTLDFQREIGKCLRQILPPTQEDSP